MIDQLRIFRLAGPLPERTFDLIKESPIIGNGNIGDFIVHNSYLYFINGYGLFGMILVIANIISIRFCSYRNIIINNLNSNSESNSNWFYYFSIPFLIISVTAEFFFTTQLMLLFIFLISIKFSDIYKNKVKKNGQLKGKCNYTSL